MDDTRKAPVPDDTAREPEKAHPAEPDDEDGLPEPLDPAVKG